MLSLAIGVMVALALLQAPSLIIRKQWPELAAFGVLWALASAYTILLAAGVEIVNPTELLRPIFVSLYRLIGLEAGF